MKFWTYIALLFCSLNIWGQSQKIEVEREKIMLGERNALRIPLSQNISPENLSDFSSLPAIKMSKKAEKDSVDVEVLSFDLQPDALILFVTAWDSGLVVIPPFALDKAQTIFTEATMFRVDFPQVEENGEILDIVEVSLDVPWFFDFEDNQWWIMMLINLILFVVGLILVLRVKVKEIEEVHEPEIVIPVEDIARKALDELYLKSQFGIEAQKLHFAEFSDILRSYIAGRYRVVTFEKTTSELVTALRLKSVPANQRGLVEELLSISDMIKFSKASTDEVEILRLKEMALEFIRISTQWHEMESRPQKGEAEND